MLRRRGIVPEQSGALFADLITRVSVPALIFHALAHATLTWRYMAMTGALVVTEAVMFVLAWMVAYALGLSRAQKGSFLLVSIFGSSALLGYALIAQLFPDNAGALAEGGVLSELGVGLPLFTAGVMIARYYGSGEANRLDALKRAGGFFRSPIFAAIVAGTLWSLWQLPVNGMLVTTLFHGVELAAGANTLLVALLVGVSLHPQGVGGVWSLAAASALMKLLLLPLLGIAVAGYFVEHAWQSEVLVLEAAMPSAMLSVAFAHRYGCDAALASRLVFLSLLLSLLTLPLTLYFLGGF